MNHTMFEVGAIVRIPLLRGGYGFGYITAHNPRQAMWALVNIFDLAQDGPETPASLEAAPVALFDLLITQLSTFGLDGDFPAWELTGEKVDFVASPRDPYFVVGDMSPKRIDLTGAEPDLPIPRSQASQYRRLGAGGGAGPTAAAEIAIRKLKLTTQELLAEYLKSKKGGVRKDKIVRTKLAPPTSKKTAINKSQFKPFAFLKDANDDSCRLIWTDVEFVKHKRIFDAADVECNGYAWTKIVAALINNERPELTKELKFDPEASTVSISGAERALKQVAAIFQNLLRNKASLKDAISKAEE